MIRQLGLGLAAGLLSALLFLSAVKGIALGFVLSYAAPLPLLMAGLGLGMGAAVIAGAAGTIVVVLGFGGLSALTYLAPIVLPALVLTNRALLWRKPQDGPIEWYPPGLILAWLTVTMLVLMLIGALMAAGHPEGVKGWVTQFVNSILDPMSAFWPAEMISPLRAWLPTALPALLFATWLVMVLVNAAGAQALLIRLGRNRRPSPAYRQLRLPDWLAAVLVISALASRLDDGDVGYVGASAALVTLIPFMLLGLAGIHHWVAGKPQARAILAVTYGLLALVFIWAAMAVAILGMVRFWTMRFRRDNNDSGMEG